MSARDEGGRVTEVTQDLRIAATMTGGVSLAIWMGGTARELNLLSQASAWRQSSARDQPLPPVAEAKDHTDAVRRLYLGLIDLLDVTIDIDVLSGTSAGGINAAVLAYARVQERDLGGLRELWLELGALLSLLRDPTDANVPSLLQGDAQMYSALCSRIGTLAHTPVETRRAPDAVTETNLFVTTTFLNGETSRFADSYGTTVQNVTHRGVFRFTEDTLDDEHIPALALAARSSASFPGAFEPSYLPFTGGTPEAGNIPARPPMAPFANITRPHWVADGGVLDNAPIGALLQTVFDRPADGEVRRVLLYIVPSAGKDPNVLDAVPIEDPGLPYGLLDGLLRDFDAIRGQSIAADLDTVRAHNANVAVRTDTRLHLAALAARLRNRDLLTDGLVKDYAKRQADAVAQPLVEAMLRCLTTWPSATGDPTAKGDPTATGDSTATGTPSTPSTPTIPHAWQGALQPGESPEKACVDRVIDTLSTRWGATVPRAMGDLVAFDRFGLDGAKSVALSILRCAYLLAGRNDERRQVARLTTKVHEACLLPNRPDITRFVGNSVTRLAKGQSPPDLATVAATLASDYVAALGSRESVAAAWPALGAVFTGEDATILSDLQGSTGSAKVNALGSNAQSPDRLKTYLDYLNPADGAEEIARRLFALFATQRAMLPAGAEVEQAVELVQVSADTRTLLAPTQATAAGKLTGEQFHHFGAFFKESWRANDWMWGRLDGSGWLVHLLLDPRRILYQATNRTEQAGSNVEWFRNQLRKLGVPDPPPGGTQAALGVDSATIAAELAFLDEDAATRTVPVSIPLTALWVAQSWQVHIAADELPVLARTVARPLNDGAASRPTREYVSPTEQAWAEAVEGTAAEALTEAAPSLLARNPVQRETLGDQVGTPLMIRTVAKTAAVLAAAVDSIDRVPAVIRPAISWTRTATLGAYRLTGAIKTTAGVLISVGFGLLALGILAAMQQSAVFGLTGLAIGATGAYLVAFGVWGLSRRVLGAVVATTALGAVAALCTPTVRHFLFGTGGGGWVGRHLTAHLSWLADPWWHPLLAVGIAVGVVTGLAYAVAQARNAGR